MTTGLDPHDMGVWTAPDQSVSITEEELLEALELFHRLDWARGPLGPAAEHDPDVRTSTMMALLLTASGQPVRRVQEMSHNPWMVTAANSALKVYSRWKEYQ